MIRTKKLVVFCFFLCVAFVGCKNAQKIVKTEKHAEKISFVKNFKTDYGLVDDNAKSDQSAIIQKGIDDLAQNGGGNILIPKGTYLFSDIYFKSNIHLFVEAGTVIKPFIAKKGGAHVFRMDIYKPKGKAGKNFNKKAYIENVSLQGYKGKFTIDYSDKESKSRIRGLICRMVKNFVVSDLDIKDNYTVFCGITLTPTRTKIKNVKDWEVSRATNGTIKNCRIFNASPGYGLVQLHGAQTVHFENIYAKGGVTLRLETGAVGEHTAVYDITGNNIVNEYGRCAVMLGPHSAQNGLIKIQNVRTKASSYAVTVGNGGVKKKELKRNPHAKPGIFAKGSYIKNIHAIFGHGAQTKKHSILEIPKEYYKDLDLKYQNKFFSSPSIGAVKYATKGLYEVIIENVTQEGFKYNTDKNILTPSLKVKWAREVAKWKKEYGTKTN